MCVIAGIFIRRIVKDLKIAEKKGFFKPAANHHGKCSNSNNLLLKQK
jgi:hypothetical protein